MSQISNISSGDAVASRRERKAIERRRAILRTAAAVFRDRGYAKASMDEIAERLDMAKGNLYYYFKNKQELLFFCQDFSLDRLIASAEAAIALDAADDEKLRRVIEDHVVCVLDELDGGAAHTEIHALPDELRALVIEKRDRYESLVREVIASGLEAGIFSGPDAKMVTLALLGALNGATHWYRPGGGRTPASIGQSFAEIFLDGLRTKAASVAQTAPAPRRATLSVKPEEWL